MVQAFGPITFGITVFSLVVSAVGVWMSIHIARRVGVMDIPNERSSHSLPTPRMGGVPMVAAAAFTFAGWVHIAVEGTLPGKGLPHTFLFALAMSVIGFLDDLKNLSSLVRFLIQMAAATLVLWMLGSLFPGIPKGNEVIPGTVWIPLVAVWVVWMLNLYNFMDGIDGLAGGEAALASSFLFIVFAYFGESGWAVANLVIAAASMGFLVHNWPPAKIFMGDAGSAFLGGFYGMQSIVAGQSTQVPFLVLVLPFANFILDATFTLIRRAAKGERWYQAHRSHIYQKLTNLGISHGRATSLELLSVAVSCVASWAYIFVGTVGKLAIVVFIVMVLGSAGYLVRMKERTLQL